MSSHLHPPPALALMPFEWEARLVTELMWTLCRIEKSLACVGNWTTPWFPIECPSYYNKYTNQTQTFLSKPSIIFVADTQVRQRLILPLWETVWVNMKDKILGKWPMWCVILFYVFIHIFNSLHVSSTLPTCTRHDHRHRVTATRGCIDTICLSWWWARCARNM